MARLTSRERRWCFGLGALYAAVVIPIGIHSGGDLVTELALSERLLQGLPRHAAINTDRGMPWPPFATFALVPLALVAQLSLPLAKGLWSAANVACFCWCLVRVRAWTGGWWAVALSAVALAQPIQSNFQHLNINLVLLALVVLAVDDLAPREGRTTRAAVEIGVAGALKVYPALVLVYFVARAHRRALAIGTATAVGLTLLAVLPYGAAAFGTLREYVVLATQAKSVGFLTGQPIGGLVARLGGPPALAVGLDLAALAAAAVAARRSPDPLYGIAVAAAAAVLLAPLDRLHFYVLLLPAWVAALQPALRGEAPRWWVGGLIVAGLLTSGLLTFPGIYPDALRVIKRNNYIWGALLLLALLLVRRQPAAVRSPQPA